MHPFLTAASFTIGKELLLGLCASLDVLITQSGHYVKLASESGAPPEGFSASDGPFLVWRFKKGKHVVRSVRQLENI